MSFLSMIRPGDDLWCFMGRGSCYRGLVKTIDHGGGIVEILDGEGKLCAFFAGDIKEMTRIPASAPDLETIARAEECAP